MFEPLQAIAGVVGTKGRELLNGNGIIGWVIFISCFIALGELPKALVRKNIGRKTLNIYILFGGTTLFVAWVLICIWVLIASAVFFIPSVIYYFKTDYLTSMFQLALFGLVVYLISKAIIFHYRLIVRVIKNGLNEHYRAIAENSQDYRVLEFRGEDTNTQSLLEQGWTQSQIWYIVEPKTFLSFATKQLKNPLIGIPLVIAGLSFWIQEWYVVHYKVKREKEAFLNMKIEMQKSTQSFNQASTTNEVTRIKVD
jgi:hypothetical protein